MVIGDHIKGSPAHHCNVNLYVTRNKPLEDRVFVLTKGTEVEVTFNNWDAMLGQNQ